MPVAVLAGRETLEEDVVEVGGDLDPSRLPRLRYGRPDEPGAALLVEVADSRRLELPNPDASRVEHSAASM